MAINVTRTLLPPLAEYVARLEAVWARGQVTNNGPLVVELEEQLKRHLGVRHLFFVSNGTVALQIAIKALELHGEVVTTPFSYVATTSAPVWEGLTPRFADIEADTLCLDAKLAEAAISGSTSAVIATHVYGNPCDVDAIGRLARARGLKVIYDAAHAFGVRYRGESVLNFGDISTLSFHATKLFHTIEGGALVTGDDALAHRIAYLRNFGHHGQEAFWGLGINGKNSEVHAAMGLCLLPRMTDVLAERKRISAWYDALLSGTGLARPRLRDAEGYNHAYHPVTFRNEGQLLDVQRALNMRDIFPRRYFHPALTRLPYVGPALCPIAEDVASRVLCLPSFSGMPQAQAAEIADIIRATLSASAGNVA